MKLLPYLLLFSMTDQTGMKVEIYKVNDSTKVEVWHRNDTIFVNRTWHVPKE